MDEDRIGRLAWILGAGERTALPALARIGGGVLAGDLGQREALDADAEPRLVHHREHGAQALVALADQPAGRALVVHDAGGIAVDAHLLLERAAGDAVARAGLAVGVGDELRHDEERDALGPLRRALDAGEHEMDDVLGEVVLAARDEDLARR